MYYSVELAWLWTPIRFFIHDVGSSVDDGRAHFTSTAWRSLLLGFVEVSYFWDSFFSDGMCRRAWYQEVLDILFFLFVHWTSGIFPLCFFQLDAWMFIRPTRMRAIVLAASERKGLSLRTLHIPWAYSIQLFQTICLSVDFWLALVSILLLQWHFTEFLQKLFQLFFGQGIWGAWCSSIS